MKSVHIQLSYKRRNIGMLEILTKQISRRLQEWHVQTYARTFENSFVGDITKLSLELDQDIKFCIP